MRRLLLALFLAMVAGRAATAVEPIDLNRMILVVVVKPPDDRAKVGVLSWLQSFKNSLRFLLADFAATGPSGTPGIKVMVRTENVDDVSTDVLESRFARQPSLQVLSTVARYGGQSTFVDNDIYLGDLKGSLALPYVYISREIRPDQYKITRDALAAVTLYAYAMAIAKAFPEANNRFVVCRALDRANMYKDGDLGKDVRDYLDKLFAAVSSELEARECGGRR